MTDNTNNEIFGLSGKLILNNLSDKKFPVINYFQNIKMIDLQQLSHVDSAGLAYMALIKSHYPTLRFSGISDKTQVLADLYGLSFIFKS